MEPWVSGVTFHRLDKNPDAGNIVHQVSPTLSVDMSVHDTAVASIVEGILAVPDIVQLVLDQRVCEGVPQTVGKTFLTKDFHPRHLIPIYDLYEGYVLRFLWDKYELPIPRPGLTSAL